jgi:hypothetical protein
MLSDDWTKGKIEYFQEIFVVFTINSNLIGDFCILPKGKFRRVNYKFHIDIKFRSNYIVMSLKLLKKKGPLKLHV